jgi:hypothetical protein
MPYGTFIRNTDKPKDRVVTYLPIVAAHMPYKSEPLRIRFTVGGDRIDYKGKVRAHPPPTSRQLIAS